MKQRQLKYWDVSFLLKSLRLCSGRVPKHTPDLTGGEGNVLGLPSKQGLLMAG